MKTYGVFTMKFKTDDFIEMFKLINNGESIRSVAKKFNVDRSYLNRKYLSFNSGNTDVIIHGKHKVFPVETKVSIIERYYNGESLAELSRHLGIGPSVVNNWIEIYNELGYTGLYKSSGRPKKIIMDTNKDSSTKEQDISTEQKLIQLQNENRKLRMENIALKKLSALVHQRKKQQMKKK